LAVTTLAGLAAYLLRVSWRTWPDPVVDFGRELYLPWRLAGGAVLYRDAQHICGPLSQYLNSVVFRLWGVSLMSLVAANLVVYAAILGLIYYLVRTGWGRAAAFVTGVFFVTVFSFAHIVGIGNYNYATPYAHETTHGLLLTLMVIVAWRSALTRPRGWKFLVVGLLDGLALLLKPEFIVSTGAVTVGAIGLLAWQQRRERRTRTSAVAVGWFFLGAILPMLLATVLFAVAAGVAWGEALQYANTAWLTVWRHAAIMQEPMQQVVLGTDAIGTNLGKELIWGAGAVGISMGAAWLCRQFAAEGRVTLGILVLGLAAAWVPLALWVPWLSMGMALPGLLVTAAAMETVGYVRREGNSDRRVVRMLLGLAAVALLLRMAFNPRISHYGFYQAPLAAVTVIATVLVAIPECLRLTGEARRFYQVALTALILAGAGFIVHHSWRIQAVQTQPFGVGADQVLTFDARWDARGYQMETVRKYLATDKDAHSLLVLPDGVMLNYQLRLPSLLPEYLFVPALLAGGAQERMVERLRASPPDRVVLLSRDMSEFGVARFGETPEHGGLLLTFIQDHYRVVFNPVDSPDSAGGQWILVLALRPDPTAASPAR
jgi:hypothetical protein